MWYNEPIHCTAIENGLVVTTDAKTDFWRITHYGFIRDNGHFYAQPITGDFTATVQIIGAYQNLYDQCGLMVRLDEQNWMKCGVEFVDGVQQASVVVTREFSDWSVIPLAQNPAAVWLRVKREGDALHIHYALDASTYMLIRVAYFPADEAVQVGIMCASPEGAGFEARFEHFQIVQD